MKKIITFLKNLIPVMLPCVSVVILAVFFMLVIWPQLGPILKAGSLFIASENTSDTDIDSEHKQGFDENTNHDELPYIEIPLVPDTEDGENDPGIDSGTEDPSQSEDGSEDSGNSSGNGGGNSSSSGSGDNKGDSSDSSDKKNESTGSSGTKKGYKQELGQVQYPATYILSQNITYPTYNEHYAMLDIYGRNVKVFFSDGKSALSKGAGQYVGSMPPGFGRPILLGGHNNSYFKNLKKYVVGDVITVTTNYGVYYYRVYDMKIAQRDDRAATHLDVQKEELILYTCYPFTTLRLTKKRYFVYAEKIAGPTVIDSLDELPSTPTVAPSNSTPSSDTASSEQSAA